MARTSLTVQILPGAYSAATTVKWTELDMSATATSSGNAFTLSGAEVLMLRNDLGTTAKVVISAVNDPFGRSVNSTIGLAASGYKVFGPIKTVGWIQTDGKCYLETTSSDIYAAVMKVPGL
jgi:hypothetical protein